MNNCATIAKSTYISRHNDALKCFVFPLLFECKLINKIPAWWSKAKIKPFYSNEDVNFWRDAPEYNGCDDEDEAKAPRPDGKLELVKGHFTSVQYIVHNIEQDIVDNCQQLCTSIVRYCAQLFAILI